MKKNNNDKKCKNPRKIVRLILVPILLVIAILLVVFKGFKVNLEYASGEVITIGFNKSFSENDFNNSIKSVLGDKKYLIRKVEFFGKAFSIKSESFSEEEVEGIRSAIKRDLGIELAKEEKDEKGNITKNDQIEKQYETNLRLRDLIKPYIIPIGVIVLFVLCYYVIRYKGTAQMISLLLSLIAAASILIILWILTEQKVDVHLIPSILTLFTLIIFLHNAGCETKELKENT